jgi:hypothetical protein
MPADIVKLADDISDLIGSNPLFVDHTISREYIIEAKIEELTSKHIWVIPGPYADTGPLDRSASDYEFIIAVVYARKYDTKGTVPKLWLDDIIELVEEELFVPLSDEHTPYGELQDYRSQAATVSLLYDPEALAEFKLFWSELEFVYRKPK